MPNKLTMLLGACGCGGNADNETRLVLGWTPQPDFSAEEEPRLRVDLYPQTYAPTNSLATIPSGFDRLRQAEQLSSLGLMPIENVPTIGEGREALWTVINS